MKKNFLQLVKENKEAILLDKKKLEQIERRIDEKYIYLTETYNDNKKHKYSSH
ncbi:FbpB family small basic protein [Metabacillus iocasae]|uniref:FbpB family small basic protein n=1 Tax=Priestia iocasae TaxID=2291674 RepID=A0ABS2QVE8_9BACI|nr:FbpB family small basic protein [Metabacillus iocasae]MBM7703455.1 hypothetical protein [Metabacillus iocasae]